MLTSIRNYIASCERTLRGIRSSLALLDAHPDDGVVRQQISEKLCNICLSADAWGFEDPCRVAADMLRMLSDLDTGTLQWNGRMLRDLDERLSLLSSRLRQYENPYGLEPVISDLPSSVSTTGNRRPA